MRSKLVLTAIFLFSNLALAVERPPQFVSLAFDGSKSTKMWKETTSFAKRNKLKFTYFISGVYFISEADKHIYQNPHRQATGRSDIGFGGTNKHVNIRNQWVNKAMHEGHEIASHANGHFDGSSWGATTWAFELQQFASFILNSPDKYGGLKNRFKRKWKQYFRKGAYLAGFRAPLLGHSSGMFQALRSEGYVYDTSKIKKANYWPQRNRQGIWNFPLDAVRMARSGKVSVSMDYNLYVAHSGGKPGPKANYKAWEDEVYETYIKLFLKNYKGNRAPIDIGHHFSLWNGGAYWKAMKRFAKAVCKLPEVICGTYQDQVEFLNKRTGSIPHYQAGNFKRMNLGRVKLPVLAKRASFEDSKEITDAELEELQRTGICSGDSHNEEEHDLELGEGVYL